MTYKEEIVLLDIGNTTIDIYSNGIIKKVLIDDFNPHLMHDKVYYSSVNSKFNEKISSLENWIDCKQFINLELYYPTMGIDRILVCEAISDGVIIDAGSAITVDVMSNGVYEGGFISLGLEKAKEAYKELSPALDMSWNFEVDLTIMPKNTVDAISFGFIAPLIQLVLGYNKVIYLTGGDAERIKYFLPQAIINKCLLFDGMKKVIDKGEKC